MKYLNLVFAALLGFTMIACGGEKKAKEITENVGEAAGDGVETLDVDEILESDESDYLEAAIEALEAGDQTTAATQIMGAVASIKEYSSDVENPDMETSAMVTEAVTELSKIAASLTAGTKMTAADLEKALGNMKFFADVDSAEEASEE